MLSIALDDYTIYIANKYPGSSSIAFQDAQYVDRVQFEEGGGSISLFLAVKRGNATVLLVLVEDYRPGIESGFSPGILLIPETQLVFIGVGERLMAYRWKPPEKIWDEAVMVGFWGWERHRQFVIMSAELELAVWDIQGKKLWSTFVEPPWTYTIEDEKLHLKVMGTESTLQIQDGSPVEK